MSLPEFQDVRNMRGHATRVAARLSMIGRHNNAQVERVPWKALATAPSWCLADTNSLLDLQRTCGALYLAPLIRSSIDGEILRELNSYIGGELFHFVRVEFQLVHPIDASQLEKRPDLQIMAAGATVLLQTLRESSLSDLFSEIIGPPGSEIKIAIAQTIYLAACSFVDCEVVSQSNVNVA